VSSRCGNARSREGGGEGIAIAGVLKETVRWSCAMAAQAGEKAEKTGDFRCEKCHQKVHVQSGHKIPKCPNCGNDTFDTRVHEGRR
jgi:Zn finger protein HypA/HybF involved in hydrogenase expression